MYRQADTRPSTLFISINSEKLSSAIKYLDKHYAQGTPEGCYCYRTI